ncbi:MAG: pantoate--beta-alanine ligase [Actinomycetota bacterium]
MILIETKPALRVTLDKDRSAGKRIGFVPTMGFLHEGHASLIRRARAECDAVVVSIFVNPLQFGPAEDLSAYPRDLARDLSLCEAEGSDYVFHPTVEQMYPRQPVVSVSSGHLGEKLCGRSRPGHFDGVATVVAKLFGIVGPCRAYFGRKDAQQLAVIRNLVDDLDIPAELVGCDTIREPDGLAMSSRNTYLSHEERGAAAVLFKALDEAAARIAKGEKDGGRIAGLLGERVSSEPLAKLDYAACVDPVSMTDVERVEGEVLLAVAAWFGKARLIDNVSAGRKEETHIE